MKCLQQRGQNVNEANICAYCKHLFVSIDNITAVCNLQRGRIVESFAGNRRSFVMSMCIHAVPHGDGWGARREGASRVGSVHNTQAESAAAPRNTGMREHGEVIIHRPEGNDPFPPKG